MQQTLIKKLQNFFPAYPVEKAWVFGSYARGEQTRKSDLDILVRFDGTATVTLIDYAGLMNNLADCLEYGKNYLPTLKTQIQAIYGSE
ncbi:MAG: nucleotidyltransferase domain-containing protein [Dysgonamonadaceae bacterium]|jgi:predicted nucleotidyltransferase|nr:nucleotidyltransferase domain-containing protein [Dysgonamonadaceae bacterium]